MMIIIDVNINHQSALGMGQNTLGDHMHIQSIRSSLAIRTVKAYL